MKTRSSAASLLPQMRVSIVGSSADQEARDVCYCT
jgi:hypothetical protein